MSTSTFTVIGMSCDHCVRSVESELGGIDGVTGVAVDLDSGQVTVESETDISGDTFAAAVEKAGYEIRS